MDDEVKSCSARLVAGHHMNGHPCTMPEGHTGMHKDADGDIQWSRLVRQEPDHTASRLTALERSNITLSDQVSRLFRDKAEAEGTALGFAQIGGRLDDVVLGNAEERRILSARIDAVLSKDMTALEERVLSALGEVEKRMTAVEGRAYAVASPRVDESLNLLSRGMATLLQRTASGVTVEHAPAMDGQCALHDVACAPCGYINSEAPGYPCVKAKGHQDKHMDEDGDTL
jgi:hypothetical protein